MYEDFLNDNVVIPEEIMRMSSEDRKAMIRLLEAEARKEKERILKAEREARTKT